MLTATDPNGPTAGTPFCPNNSFDRADRTPRGCSGKLTYPTATPPENSPLTTTLLLATDESGNEEERLRMRYSIGVDDLAPGLVNVIK